MRIVLLVYAGIAYLSAMASIAYVAGFLLGYGVPKGINDGPDGPFWLALVVDVGLVALFGLHHSVAARPGFKAWLTRFVPAPAERASYLYATTAMTALLVVFWRPIPVTIWHVDTTLLAAAIVTACALTWAMMVAATFHFGHFSFFGLRQAVDHLRGRATLSSSFSARCLYGMVRHPISLGWMLIPWLTPHMTIGQLVFALSVAVYVVLATPYEERDLVADLGRDYVEYRKRVPAFVPGAARTRSSVAARRDSDEPVS